VTRFGSDVIEPDGLMGEGGGVASSRTESRLLAELPKNDHFLRSRLLTEEPPGVACPAVSIGTIASAAARASIVLNPSTAEGVRV
jgi:hypothetical protein